MTSKNTNGRQSQLSFTTKSAENGKEPQGARSNLDVTDENSGKVFLIRSQILPPGTEFSTSEMAKALGKVIEMITKTPKNAAMAIKAIAHILEGMDMEEIAAKAATRILDQKLNSALDTLRSATDAITKDLAKTVSEQIDEMKTQVKNMAQATHESIKNVSDRIQTPAESQTAYRDAILREIRTPQVDPRIQALEMAKNRQFLFDIERDDSPMRSMSNSEILEKLNNAIKEAERDAPHKVRMAQRYNNGGVMFEMCTDEGARWLKDKDNGWSFRLAAGIDTEFKKRAYNVIAQFVPLQTHPDNPQHMDEIRETNCVEADQLTRARWAKPPGRRHPKQVNGHMILTFADADEANRAILGGLVICNKKVTVVKCKKEPIRCLKCHGWNHLARECTSSQDTCGTCGETTHRTNECKTVGHVHCVSCNSDDHASWDRGCAVFARKCADYDKRHPENALPFYPSTEPWTWSTERPNMVTRTSQKEHTPTTAPEIATKKGTYTYTQGVLNFGTQAKPLAHDRAPNGKILERARWDREESQPPNSQLSQEKMPDRNPSPLLYTHPNRANSREDSTPQNTMSWDEQVTAEEAQRHI